MNVLTKIAGGWSNVITLGLRSYAKTADVMALLRADSRAAPFRVRLNVSMLCAVVRAALSRNPARASRASFVFVLQGNNKRGRMGKVVKGRNKPRKSETGVPTAAELQADARENEVMNDDTPRVPLLTKVAFLF